MIDGESFYEFLDPDLRPGRRILAHKQSMNRDAYGFDVPASDPLRALVIRAEVEAATYEQEKHWEQEKLLDLMKEVTPAPRPAVADTYERRTLDDRDTLYGSRYGSRYVPSILRFIAASIAVAWWLS